ncbi:hypothetical protein PVAND_016945 [Polypedilum vanderplanki]|uniref:Uncharacterized protein n=1 Tax=Polypedilum vanderplanki TaxID=319348 RepID=A0A9J6BGR4_POLVA|nr:hypothetical protein PVAND_016945 [Polypedilum vanderplanki]
MSLTYAKEDFILEKESVNILFLFSDEIKLNEKKYCDELCTKFGAKTKCPIKMKSKRINVNSITFIVSCLINTDFKYSLKCYKEDIISGEKLKFEVMCNTDKLCQHGSVIEGRPLKGNSRKVVQNELLNKTPKQVRNEAIANLDEIQVEAGNMTTCHPLGVYQKVRSEALARTDKATDSMKDLEKRAKIEREDGQIFIQYIATLPFSLILFNENSLRFLHQLNKSNMYTQGYLDATGGIIRKISESNLLIHCLVIPTKSNMINSTNCVLVLAEMITEDNCSFNIEHFLRLIKTKYQLIFKDSRMFRSIVTDKSFANINAIIQSQNGITLPEYLEKMYEIRFNQNEFKDITYVFLCSSHLAKIWKNDIEKFFKHLDKEDIYMICGLIGNAVNFRRYENLKTYLEQLMKFFLLKSAGPEFEYSLQKLNDTLNDDESNDWVFKTNADKNDDQGLVGQSFQQKNDEESKVIYKQSPFFIEFQKHMQDLLSEDDKDDDDETNIFYCPAFIKHFLKNSIAFLPFWSAIYFVNESNSDNQICRPNNGYVEGHFSSLKNFFRNDLSFGKLGTIKIGRYVEAVKDKNKTTLKELKLKIPNKHMSRKQKNLSTVDLPAEREQWKGKSKDSSTVMFHRENLLRKLDAPKNMLDSQK